MKVLVFSDASEQAIASVAYLYGVDKDGNAHLGFVMGKAKLAPKNASTIPRLELCAAVLNVVLAQIISNELKISLDHFTFFTDSRVVLGYIHNRTRRFAIYVSNRVQKIHQVSDANQWQYVPSNCNPADRGTKVFGTETLNLWLTGPRNWIEEKMKTKEVESYDIINPDEDCEIKIDVTTIKLTNERTRTSFDISKFERFSTWESLVRALTNLRIFVKRRTQKESSHPEIERTTELIETEKFIIRQIQRQSYPEEIKTLSNGKEIRKSSIIKLNPKMDNDGILRLHGRLVNSSLEPSDRNPMIIPGKSHIALLLTRHYHAEIHHQGRHLTEGAIRSAGFWITDGPRLISSVIQKCVM